MFDYTQAPLGLGAQLCLCWVKLHRQLVSAIIHLDNPHTHESRSIPSVFDHILITCILPGVSLSFHFVWGKFSAPLSLSLSLSLHCLIILKLNFNPILITWCLSRTFQLFHNPTGDIHANHVIMTWMPKKLHFSLSMWSQRDWTNKRYVGLVKCT